VNKRSKSKRYHCAYRHQTEKQEGNLHTQPNYGYTTAGSYNRFRVNGKTYSAIFYKSTCQFSLYEPAVRTTTPGVYQPNDLSVTDPIKPVGSCG
jgi:hypothetical protein